MAVSATLLNLCTKNVQGGRKVAESWAKGYVKFGCVAAAKIENS